ncbi:CvpA family protein [bacterium]|jgi:membrane protein required for colicin V production|nr:CvpA family protein [bacterium]
MDLNIIIIVFVVYFAYLGFKNGWITELTNIISILSAFLLSQSIGPIIEKYLILETFIKDPILRAKIGYLLSFIMIVSIFKILNILIEKYIEIKWKHKILGIIMGMIKGALILSLIISIFKELLPSNNVHENWREKSYLYRKLDTLQKEYLMQYKKLK